MNKKKLLAGPYLLWMVAFTVIPLIMIAVYGFTDRTGAFTWENVTAMIRPEHMKALWLSLKLAFLCTAVCLFLAYPLALILKAKGVKKGSFVVMVFILPMWMNFLLRTYAWLNLLDDGGILCTLLEKLGLARFSIIGTNTAIVLGMVYNFLPFMVLPLYNVISKIDENVINAAPGSGGPTGFRYFGGLFCR